MPSRFERYRMTDGKTPLAGRYFNPVFQDLDLRLADLELLRVSWVEAVRQVSDLGIARINELVGGPMEVVEASIVDLQRRLAEVPEAITRTALDEALEKESTARAQLVQSLEGFRKRLEELSGTDVFPSVEGMGGKVLMTDGGDRYWGLPPVTSLGKGSATARQLLGIGVGGAVVGLPPMELLSYEGRGLLRERATGAAFVQGLGLFAWDTQTTAVDLDDDATVIAADGGVWRLLAMCPQQVLQAVESAQAHVRSDFVHARFEMLATSLAAGAELSYQIPVPGLRRGDHVVVTPVDAPAVLGVQGRADDGMVTVVMVNPKTAALTLTPAVWAVLGIKNRSNLK